MDKCKIKKRCVISDVVVVDRLLSIVCLISNYIKISYSKSLNFSLLNKFKITD